MQDVLRGLYAVVEQRKAEPQEGSYTCYLLDKGLDKNGQQEETVGEICDLMYHLLVMMVDQGIPLEAVEAELEQRRQKIGNLKQFHVSDHNS